MQNRRLDRRLCSPILLLVFGSGCCTEGPRAPDVAAITVPLGPSPAGPATPTVLIPRADQGRFAARVRYGDQELILNGSGLCEWGFLGIDLYQAALYLERRPENATQALAGDQVMVIHLQFVRQLTGEQLRAAYSASVQTNTGERFARYQAALRQLNDCLNTVEAGDAYSFIADPERGLLVQRDGSIVGRIEDAAFRQLFVRLYLGAKPPTAALRQSLLGGVR